MSENNNTSAGAQDFSKVVRIGTSKARGRREYSIFAKIEFKGGRLSISGVEGPLHDGNAIGGCGQIDGTLREHLADITPAPAWTPELIARFLDAWDRWHLNDMRAACEHQRNLDTGEQITTYFFRLQKWVNETRRANEKEALAALNEGKSVAWSDDAVKVANLPAEYKSDSPELPEQMREYYQPNGPQYTGDHYNVPSKTERAGHVSHKEHPKGLLGKPCEVCGYRYGSAWLREEVPADVVEFLRNLPDTDITPAWV